MRRIKKNIQNEEKKYNQIKIMVDEAHKEVITFVKKNIENDSNLQLHCS